MSSDKDSFSSGVTSSKGPRFELIPRSALISLAGIFEKGQSPESHGAHAWNAQQNPTAADDLDFVRSRLGHGIDHILKALARLAGTLPYDPTEDDAGTIMFCGALLAEHLSRKPKAEGVLSNGEPSRQFEAPTPPGMFFPFAITRDVGWNLVHVNCPVCGATLTHSIILPSKNPVLAGIEAAVSLHWPMSHASTAPPEDWTNNLRQVELAELRQKAGL